MADYQCTHCDDTFEHQGHAPPRCPRCLRRNGLLPVGGELSPAGDEAPGEGSRRRLLRIALALCALGLAAGAALYMHLRATDVPMPGQLAQLDQETLHLTLAARGLPADIEAPHPLAGGEAVAALASEAGQGEDAAKRAQAVAQLLAGKLNRAAPLLNTSPSWPARTPDALLKALVAREPTKVTSLELASLLVALLRAADLSAVLAERFTTTAPMSAPDPSGYLGRYVAVVFPRGKLGAEPIARLDPLRSLKLPGWAVEQGEPGMSVSGDQVILLGDASAAAHLLSQRALAAAPKKPEQAYKLSLAAQSVSAPSATLILARAQVLAASGGLKDALGAARKALATRQDAPRQAGLARLLLMNGDPDGAVAELRLAIKKSPRFWPARLLLASVLGRVDPDKAEEHLRAGLEVAPEEPGLLLLDGAWHLSRKMPSQAAERLQKVAAALPGNLDVKLMLYHALVSSSQPDEAAALRKELLSKADKPEEMKQRLEMADKAAAAATAEDDPGDGENMPGPGFKLPDVSLGK